MRHILLVLSGKGGVGKSTISTELALSLRHSGKKVSEGLGCCSLAGPSPHHLGMILLVFHAARVPKDPLSMTCAFFIRKSPTQLTL